MLVSLRLSLQRLSYCAEALPSAAIYLMPTTATSEQGLILIPPKSAHSDCAILQLYAYTGRSVKWLSHAECAS